MQRNSWFNWETHQKDGSPSPIPPPPFPCQTTFVDWMLRDALGLGMLELGAAPSDAMSWSQWGRLPPVAQPMGLEVVFSCAVAIRPLQPAGI